MKITAKEGQTLADIAVQEFGSWEAAVDMAFLNGLSVTDVPAAGTVLSIPDNTYNQTMQIYCKNNNVSPATAKDNSGIILRIFGEEFTRQFI
jgi:hypothetical protein